MIQCRSIIQASAFANCQSIAKDHFWMVFHNHESVIQSYSSDCVTVGNVLIDFFFLKIQQFTREVSLHIIRIRSSLLVSSHHQWFGFVNHQLWDLTHCKVKHGWNEIYRFPIVIVINQFIKYGSFMFCVTYCYCNVLWWNNSALGNGSFQICYYIKRFVYKHMWPRYSHF